MRALITGITGFVGSHLAEYLLSQGLEVDGTYRWRSRMDNIDSIKHKIGLIECDLRDPFSTYSAIKRSEPDYIFHLAAQSFVRASFDHPAGTIDSNVHGTINVLEGVRHAEINPVIQVACSSEEYGFVTPQEVPIKETNPLRPLSPYAVSKVAEEMLAYQYHKSYGLKTIITRTFNHEGPRRGDVFVTSNFAKQVAEIEKGKRSPIIQVGNLNAQRDYTDVRDVVRAYYLAVQKCDYAEAYNICSGRPWVIRDMLNYLVSKSHKKDIRVEVDQSRMRPSDVEILHGDYSKFHQKTGWKPEIPFEKTLDDTLDYWRARIV
ncbi:MAG: GDP-mannose 4,6-dehydratase [Candidatus Diapherotrites archaeon]|uniref:GDP-mannose 4,6-dehydratase n=1 Tax=Candidatus Iainarchaeum sp. TaxID=3101447 RepID=A0A8T4C9W4_9ARCH|nr:GDP-mannose 4,6-dehydratase [Candidatus Diapherotrites archaeon]